MPTNYQRGKALEDRARRQLERDGYWCISARGSKGAADVVALKPGQVLMVQCKRAARGMTAGEHNALHALATGLGAVPVYAEAVPRGPVTWWRLTAPRRPYQRAGTAREPFLTDFANDPLITANKEGQ